MQAVTRMNTEQASKRLMRKPTRQEYGEGRCHRRMRAKRSLWFRRGSGDGMCGRGRRNTGSPITWWKRSGGLAVWRSATIKFDMRRLDCSKNYDYIVYRSGAGKVRQAARLSPCLACVVFTISSISGSPRPVGLKANVTKGSQRFHARLPEGREVIRQPRRPSDR